MEVLEWNRVGVSIWLVAILIILTIVFVGPIVWVVRKIFEKGNL